MSAYFYSPTNARDMVRDALRRSMEFTMDQDEIEIDSVDRHPEHDKTIIAGTATVNNEPWQWEISYGTGQDRIAVFDELEVAVFRGAE